MFAWFGCSPVSLGRRGNLFTLDPLLIFSSSIFNALSGTILAQDLECFWEETTQLSEIGGFRHFSSTLSLRLSR